MINNNNFITIQGWMVTDLQLSGTDLLVYAVIYGFSQDGESVFSGSIQYLQEWTGAGRNTVKRSLQKLCENGLITKIERSGKINFYKANCNTSDPAQNDPAQNGLTVQNEQDPAQNGTGTQPKMDPDNINNNIYKNNINNTRTREKKPKHKYGDFENVLLTDNELDKLKQKFPDDWKERIEDLSYWLKSKGVSKKDHYATILNWDRMDKKRKKENLPFTDVAPRSERDNAALDRILEQIGGDEDE